MQEYKTHNDSIKTLNFNDNGTVYYDCAIWGLEDNTQGKIGWHAIYRPLHDAKLPKKLLDETREHIHLVVKMKEKEEEEKNLKFWKKIEEMRKNPEPQLKEWEKPCPLCGTFCWGDCQAD